jgi:hypothetical protein
MKSIAWLSFQWVPGNEYELLKTALQMAVFLCLFDGSFRAAPRSPAVSCKDETARRRFRLPAGPAVKHDAI